MKLFQDGDFTSHAGLPLKWKLECDAITDEEWRCIAKMIMDYQTEPFSKAVGIPRGGLKLAEALQPYASNNSSDQVLICDDVFTTGTSMVDFIKEHYPNWTRAMGHRWVVFARNKSYVDPYYTRALFQMPV
ncbi:MAG: hypothetical protein CMA64_08970 [Euryarchaeota archaeon]|jgi:hypothetical protein|nr:hypothetical protein [Euryarchaeota archaeon]